MRQQTIIALVLACWHCCFNNASAFTTPSPSFLSLLSSSSLSTPSPLTLHSLSRKNKNDNDTNHIVQFYSPLRLQQNIFYQNCHRLSTTKLHATREEENILMDNSAGTTTTTTRSTATSPFTTNNLTTTADHHEDAVYKDAVQRTLGWVGLSCLFGAGLLVYYGSDVGEEFFAGYLLEQSLSVDNLLVFLLLFEYFKVPKEYENRVLNWGIVGAIIMRAIMIGIGAVAIQQFHGVLLVFAAILIYSSAKVLLSNDDDKDDSEDLSQNAIVQFSKSVIHSTDKFDGDRFFTMVDGVKQATPLFLCMVAVEVSDVVFAVDSIPAVFGVTENPLVVFSSNIFAIMGLRSLYAVLSKAASDLEYLEPAVAVVLGFIGVKMVAEYFGIMVPTELSLGVVLTLLSTGVGASIVLKKEEEEET